MRNSLRCLRTKPQLYYEGIISRLSTANLNITKIISSVRLINTSHIIGPMKIPKIAKEVFSGVIYDIYHWEQRMFDGSYGTFEMLRRPSTIEIIATSKKRFSLQNSSNLEGNRITPFLEVGRKNPRPLLLAQKESFLKKQVWNQKIVSLQGVQSF